MQTHQHYMQQAIRLGWRGVGRTAPNPSVGCVILDADDQCVGTGWTQSGGRPHAETIALGEAGKKARGGTAYVTLEPCAHVGKTGSCAKALIDVGVRRVVFANTDPDPRVAGRGAAILRTANVEVIEHIEAEPAAHLHAGFFTRVCVSRPLVTLKLALSANGFMRTPAGRSPQSSQSPQSPWITGPLARNYGHLLRAQNDAIVIGTGTLMADNPSLDCRLPGMQARSPLPVIINRRALLPQKSKLAQRAKHAPVLLFTENAAIRDIDQNADFEIVQMANLSPLIVLQDLARRGITRVLLECGPRLAHAFLAENLVDAVALFEAPVEVDMVGASDISRMGLDLKSDFIAGHSLRLGEDRFTLWHCPPDKRPDIRTDIQAGGWTNKKTGREMV